MASLARRASIAPDRGQYTMAWLGYRHGRCLAGCGYAGMVAQPRQQAGDHERVLAQTATLRASAVPRRDKNRDRGPRGEARAAASPWLPGRTPRPSGPWRNHEAEGRHDETGDEKSVRVDDPLETQIASVSQQINNVAQNWQHRVDDVDLVQYRIDEVTDSLQNDAL